MVQFDVARGWPKEGSVGSGAFSSAMEAFLCNHTLLVGQSRSGKTNAARRIVEEVLAHTAGRVVILDANADFAEVHQLDDRTTSLVTANAPKDDTDKRDVAFAEEWARQASAIIRVRPRRPEGVLGRVRDPSGRLIREAVRNHTQRLVVVDLSLDDAERYAYAGATLAAVWELGKEQRGQFNSKGPTEMSWRGTLVVIDEAHLFAPREVGPLNASCSERIERISDQGKKLNLYLLLITQQPGKLNQRILAEADNRIVMRMNDRLSLKVLENIYGGQPGRYDGALTFEQGWALIEGALVCDAIPPDARPRGIKFGRGRTKAGGGTADKRWVISPSAGSVPNR